ncbi:unnamed protein product [Albugo candida]|nr:unnamed protein product [Albugo candida]|eukprot:CCI46609.1 unnamed protein product [Albugo candida]
MGNCLRGCDVKSPKSIGSDAHSAHAHLHEAGTFLARDAAAQVEESTRSGSALGSLCTSEQIGKDLHGETSVHKPAICDLVRTAAKSARQAKRLEKFLKAENRVNDQSDCENFISNDDVAPKKIAIGFQCLQDSESDSVSNSESDSESHQIIDSKKQLLDPNKSQLPTKSPPVSFPTKPLENKKKKSQKSKQRHLIPQISTNKQPFEAIKADRNNPIPNATETWNELLRVQVRLTNAEREMKRIFNMKAEKETNKKTGNNRFRDPNKVAWRSLRKALMVTPSDTWPRPPPFIGGGIRWARCPRPDGEFWAESSDYYQIVWSSEYEKSSKAFQFVQTSHDPQALAEFLYRNPYHLDALIQMSRVYQHHGQMDHATDCIKRCMYVCELSWSENFDVSNGNSRMDYRIETNATFYKALFMYMQQAGRRGCMRSAFELARMIFALDPHGDPVSVVLALDYYALASRQYAFILALLDANIQPVDRFTESARSEVESHSLSSLPNLYLSSALAMFHSGKKEAQEQLAKALLMYPSVLSLLLDACKVRTTSEAWKSVVENSRFADARPLSGDSVLAHVLSIYVTRHSQLWKSENVSDFLYQSAKLAIDSSVLKSAYPQMMELPPSLLKYHRAALQDYTDEVTMLPEDDPIPQQMEQMNQMAVHLPLENIQNGFQDDALSLTGNPLLLFLQSLLPWNVVQTRDN